MVQCVTDNTNVTSASAATFNANSMIFGTAGASVDIYANDYSLLLDTAPTEAVAQGWNFVAWHIYVNGASDIVISQKVLYDGQSTFQTTSSTVTIASLRTLLNTNSATSNFNAWTPGAVSRFILASDTNSTAGPFNLTRCRVDQISAMPSDATLLTISANGLADTTVWADYSHEWISGAADLTDRSGHGRNLTLNGTLYQGVVSPAYAAASFIATKPFMVRQAINRASTY